MTAFQAPQKYCAARSGEISQFQHLQVDSNAGKKKKKKSSWIIHNTWITRRWRYFTFISSLLIQCNAQGDASIQWTAELIDFLNNFSNKMSCLQIIKEA